MKKFTFLFVLLAVFTLVFFSCKSQQPADESNPTGPQAAASADKPALGVRMSSRYFSPDGDGIDDNLTIYLTCNSPTGITSWSFEIFESQAPNLLFYQWTGNTAVPPSLTWNGRSTSGEVVQSAMDYNYTFKATNSAGTSEIKGVIEVDVLIIKDGDILRIQIPSIHFGPNIGDFTGVTPQITADNDYVLRRIATTLNKFNTYQIRIEGHANPTAPTAAARLVEHERELIPLSEQRARTVMEYLVTLNVARSRLSYIAMGGSRTIVSYEDHDNWWKNRRVEFILIKNN